MLKVPFNSPFLAGTEAEYVNDAINGKHRHGDGHFTHSCQEILCKQHGVQNILLTTSCTAALEMSALLTGVGGGDEIIMPSFTFASTANAFALRGATPVFVDINPETQNIEPSLVENAISDKTKAIVVVHYGGVSCDMDTLMRIADAYGLYLIEDSAQGIGATYKGRPLGSIGHLACLSFHDSKNISSGEGGALIINKPELRDRAEILWEKGTNRRQFLRNEISQYSWVDLGSSFLPSEITAAFLLAQLDCLNDITNRRVSVWRQYDRAFKNLDVAPQAMYAPKHCVHNGHLFYLVLPPELSRVEYIDFMRSRGIYTTFHYVPLHSSPAGRRLGRTVGPMVATNCAGEKLVRLPLFPTISQEQIDHVVSSSITFLRDKKNRRIN